MKSQIQTTKNSGRFFTIQILDVFPKITFSNKKHSLESYKEKWSLHSLGF